jgi:hypothetical protein
MFIKLLIAFFLLLICYLTFDNIYYNFVGQNILEGLENGGSYKEYDGEDPLILAKQNAGNISALKMQMDDILALKQEVTDMSLNMVKMSGQINEFANIQAEKSDELVGTEEPTITGATDEGVEEPEPEE